MMQELAQQYDSSASAGGSAGFAVVRRQAAEVLLTLSFVASFLPYVFGVSTATLLAAIAVFLATAWIGLPALFAHRVTTILAGLRRPRLAVFALLLPLAPSIVAIGSSSWDAVGYAGLMALTLVSCQIVLCVLPFEGIFRSFSRAAALSVLVFVAIDAGLIWHAFRTATRLMPPHAQPNTIGFVFVGYALAFVWCAFDRRRSSAARTAYALTGAMTVWIIYLASSRASLAALGGALLLAAALATGRQLQRRRLANAGSVAAVAILLAAAAAVAAFRPISVVTGVAYVNRALHLDSRHRGIGSGLSGRVERWEAAFATMESSGLWLPGAGYRRSQAELGFSVDNSYLVIAYEQGVFGVLAVVGQFVWCLGLAAREYLTERSAKRRHLLLAVVAVVSALLINNFFDRYLFGVGNPFSLLGLFFLLVGSRQLRPGGAFDLRRGAACGTPPALPGSEWQAGIAGGKR